MQEAIPYRRGRATWPAIDMPSSYSSSSSSSSEGGGTHHEGTVRARVAENPVLVVGRRGCCMCHVVKLLLLGLGVNPATCDVGDVDETELAKELGEIGRKQDPILLPAVFIGGRLVGGLDRLMAIHISGDLVPLLKAAGALWL